MTKKTPSETNSNTQEQPENDGVVMRILAQYIRDLSFENILAQKGTDGQVNPDIGVNVSIDARKRNTEHQYEVIMKLSVTAASKDNTLFVVEMEYGGLFHIENVPQEQLHPFLMIECPRQLFPFVRRIISDITRDGGFPPLNIDQINFLAIYQQEIARRIKENQDNDDTPSDKNIN